MASVQQPCGDHPGGAEEVEVEVGAEEVEVERVVEVARVVEVELVDALADAVELVVALVAVLEAVVSVEVTLELVLLDAALVVVLVSVVVLVALDVVVLLALVVLVELDPPLNVPHTAPSALVSLKLSTALPIVTSNFVLAPCPAPSVALPLYSVYGPMVLPAVISTVWFCRRGVGMPPPRETFSISASEGGVAGVPRTAALTVRSAPERQDCGFW